MKVLVVTRGFPPHRGGSENYIWEVYKRLSKSYEMDLITYYSKEREKNESFHEIKPLKTNNKFLEFLNFFVNTFKNSLFMDFDVIHAVTYPGGLCALLPKFVSGKPLVVTIHDIGVIEKEIPNVSPFTKLLKGSLQGIVCQNADAIIVPSEKVRNDIMKCHGVKKSKIFVTAYGIDERFFGGLFKRGIIRSRWKIGKAPLILYVGMYSPKKGLEYLIRAFKEVKKNITDAILMIAGPSIDNGYEKKVRSVVKDYGLKKSVIFTGYFAENLKPNIYLDSDIVVEPTMYGMGYSFACIEASSFGKPVIATKLLEDIGVVKNNVSGLVVPTRNSELLAESIIKVLKDRKLYNRLSDRGMEFAKKFNWDATADQTSQVYERVARANS